MCVPFDSPMQECVRIAYISVTKRMTLTDEIYCSMHLAFGADVVGIW